MHHNLNMLAFQIRKILLLINLHQSLFNLDTLLNILYLKFRGVEIKIGNWI